MIWTTGVGAKVRIHLGFSASPASIACGSPMINRTWSDDKRLVNCAKCKAQPSLGERLREVLRRQEMREQGFIYVPNQIAAESRVKVRKMAEDAMRAVDDILGIPQPF